MEFPQSSLRCFICHLSVELWSCGHRWRWLEPDLDLNGLRDVSMILMWCFASAERQWNLNTDWGWTREFKVGFQHQNHTNVHCWIPTGWSSPSEMFLLMDPFYFSELYPMKHMYDKKILTHRFTSTLIGSGDLYSSKNQCFRGKQIFSEMSQTKSYRWCCREADGLPASCCVVLLLFFAVCASLCSLGILLNGLKAESFICDQRETFSPH